MRKPTLATLKSFIKRNDKNLYIKVKSSFDGMVDCVMPVEDEFRKVESINMENKYTLGIQGAWLVGGSRNYIKAIEDGYEVYNCCGTWQIITK